jgi:hypothetical protein
MRFVLSFALVGVWCIFFSIGVCLASGRVIGMVFLHDYIGVDCGEYTEEKSDATGDEDFEVPRPTGFDTQGVRAGTLITRSSGIIVQILVINWKC